MRAHEFIVEGYREAQQEFAIAAEPQAAAQTIAQFKELVNKNQAQGQERNIDHWRKQGWDAFSQFVQQAMAKPTATQVKRKKIPGKSIMLVDNPQWLVVVPLDKDASCFHGKNSDWCTTKINAQHFEEYYYNRDVVLIYCLNKQSGGMWAIAGHSDVSVIEIFDQQDRPLTMPAFTKQTGLDPLQLVQLALGTQHSPVIAASKKPYQDHISAINAYFKSPRNGRSAEAETSLLFTKSSKLAAKYVQELIDDQPNDLTQVPVLLLSLALAHSTELASNPKFPIARVPERDIVNIIRDGGYIVHFANKTPAMIDAALSSNILSYQFLKRQLDQETINRYPKAAAAQAKSLQQENPVAEPGIMADPVALYYYLHVKSKPWPEAESTILQNADAILLYVKNALHGDRWPAGEAALLEIHQADPAATEDGYALARYASTIQMRWREAEPFILQSEDPEIPAGYAVDTLKQRWPALEPRMLEVSPQQDQSGNITRYARMFKWHEYQEYHRNGGSFDSDYDNDY